MFGQTLSFWDVWCFAIVTGCGYEGCSLLFFRGRAVEPTWEIDFCYRSYWFAVYLKPCIMRC